MKKRQQPAAPHGLLLIGSHDEGAFTLQREAVQKGLSACQESDIATWCRLVNTRYDAARYRGVAYGADRTQLTESLAQLTTCKAGKAQPQVWLFPGQGTQQIGMGAELYHHLPHYRTSLTRWRRPSSSAIRLISRRRCLPETIAGSAAPGTCQLSLFACSYALAQSVMQFGPRPAAVMGHRPGRVLRGGYRRLSLAGRRAGQWFISARC